MADLNLVNGYLNEGQRDFTCSNNASADELQLAALLGKTLLEKNSELDNKLKRVQEFAEETLLLNQSLTRQLSESRDSLQLSSNTCEQLEARVEELERANAHLKQQLLTQQVSLDHKSQEVQSLENELSEIKVQNEHLRAQQERNRWDSKEATLSKETITRERPKSYHSNSEVSMETDSRVSELTGRLHKLIFQKEKAERKLAKVEEENESLVRNLERAELEIDELTNRVSMFEDAVELHGTPLSTPKHTHSTPTLLTSFTLPPIPEHPPQPSLAEEKSHDSGLSLFNELDSEFNSLRHNFDKLVQGCTCEASRHYKSWSEEVDTAHGDVASDKKSIEQPYKKLFEEMFATLKQTAQVADRLMEKKKRTGDN